MMTERQQQVLEFLRRYQNQHGVSASIPDIAAHFGFASPRAAAKLLEHLETHGAIRRTPGARRAIQLVDAIRPEISPAHLNRVTSADFQRAAANQCSVPLLGRVAAGRPLSAGLDAPEGNLQFDIGLFPVVPDFFHEVSGYSMVNAGILPGDKVGTKRSAAVPNRAIVTAVIIDPATGDPELTIKRYERRGEQIILHSENDDLERYPPLHFDTRRDAIEILGRYCALIRSPSL